MQKTNNLQDLFSAPRPQVPRQPDRISDERLSAPGTDHGYDAFVVVLMTGDKQQVIYKHAISTIVPERAISLEAEGAAD